MVRRRFRSILSKCVSRISDIQTMHWLNIERGQMCSTKKTNQEREQEMKHLPMKQTLTIPGTFLGIGYTKDRAGLPLEAVRVPVPQPGADQVLIRVATSSLNPLEYKLADL